LLEGLVTVRFPRNLVSAPLAFWPTANGLTGLKLRGLENLLTIATPPFDHTGVVPLNGIGGEF
jgi:hypothetical protein